MNKRLLYILILLAVICQPSSAQLDRLIDSVKFQNEFKGTLSGGDFAPYWMTNNQYGLSTNANNSIVWRRSLKRDLANDAGRKWQTGWGIEYSNVFAKNDSRNVIQELYLDLQYQKVRLSVGAKQRPSEKLNPELSSGGLVSGTNARPIPQVRVEVPEFWTIPGTNNWLALKGHIAFGMYTDNGWQSDFASGTTKAYSKNSLYHTKAGFLRVGNKYEFPVTFTGGFEMNTQFAGTAYNVKKRADDQSGFVAGTVKMPANLNAFWHALIPGGADATDAGYDNAEGNTIGAWHFCFDIHGIDWAGDENWHAKAYAEHMFEDHSQLFVQYGWKDWLLGLEVNLPKNPYVSDIVYEYLTLRHQSGPIYHDKTTNIPDQVSAVDDYYNHGIYGAWQHAGYGLGNSLLISPIYNADHSISFKHNRIKAHHIGVTGQPLEELSYKALFSWERSWGTYRTPLVDPQEGWSIFVQAKYTPHWFKGSTFGIGFGHNGGKLLGTSNGVQFSFGWNRFFGKKVKNNKIFNFKKNKE